MPASRPNEAPCLMTHSRPRGPSVTKGMRSRKAADAFAVNRSGGSQIRWIWQSAEITSYFMLLPSLRRGCSRVTRRGADYQPQAALYDATASGLETYDRELGGHFVS